jgi:hypothetical protein
MYAFISCIPPTIKNPANRINLTVYKSKKKEFISIFPILWGTPMFYTNSLEVMRQTVGSGTNIGWQKPEWYVPNIVPVTTILMPNSVFF